MDNSRTTPFSYIHSRYSFCIILAFLLCSHQGFSQSDSIIPCISTKMSRLHGFSGSGVIPMDKTDISVLDTEIYYIPVVFHIIYTAKNFGPDQLSDKDILSQIEVLNEDFGRQPGTNGYNTRSIGADTRIRFCLATKDPNGNPTTGIERIKTSNDNITSSTEMRIKNLSRWNQKYYLNIWVVDQIDGGDRTAGYSYLAHDVSNKDSAQEIDGTVVNYRFVGKNTGLQSSTMYQSGRTLTHELGHYCDMHHPWGDDDINACGDDGVYDTPPCDNVYFSKFANKCDSPFQCGYFRLVEDYMDYSDDRCMNLYTIGQAKKMRGALRQFRPNLISCPNHSRTGCAPSCEPASLTYTTDDIEVFPNPTVSSDINFRLFLSFEQNLDFYIYDNLGQTIYQQTGVTGSGGDFRISLPGMQAGIYYALIKGKSQFFRKRIVIIGPN